MIILLSLTYDVTCHFMLFKPFLGKFVTGRYALFLVCYPQPLSRFPSPYSLSVSTADSVSAIWALSNLHLLFPLGLISIDYQLDKLPMELLHADDLVFMVETEERLEENIQKQKNSSLTWLRSLVKSTNCSFYIALLVKVTHVDDDGR